VVGGSGGIYWDRGVGRSFHRGWGYNYSMFGRSYHHRRDHHGGGMVGGLGDGMVGRLRSGMVWFGLRVDRCSFISNLCYVSIVMVSSVLDCLNSTVRKRDLV